TTYAPSLHGQIVRLPSRKVKNSALFRFLICSFRPNNAGFVVLYWYHQANLMLLNGLWQGHIFHKEEWGNEENYLSGIVCVHDVFSCSLRLSEEQERNGDRKRDHYFGREHRQAECH
ncbi:MAG: hypothetical protein IKR22_09420, partial [Clostridiales bacterium]|nr:hypothetical protein [Clostridiales bacterium]